MKEYHFTKGKTYKGCIHCHSTVSPDALYTPEELKNLYKAHGYSFLALTDHNVFTWHDEFNDPEFIVWPASEAAVNCTDSSLPGYECSKFHSCLLISSESRGIRAKSFTESEWTSVNIDKKDNYKDAIQENINMWLQKSCIVTANHPVWSRLDIDTLMRLNGYFALEIYNAGCECLDGITEGTFLWDGLLQRGKKVWGIATDDTHGRNRLTDPPSKVAVDDGRFEGLHGWVVANSDELTIDKLATALQIGDFYASTGPELYDFYIDNNNVHVRCSEVEKIRFFTYVKKGRTLYGNKKGDLITEAVFPISGTEQYVRVECVDRFGQTAWSNPIFLNELK